MLGSTTRRHTGADEITHSNQSDARRIDKKHSNVSGHGSLIFTTRVHFSVPREVLQSAIVSGSPQCDLGFNLQLCDVIHYIMW